MRCVSPTRDRNFSVMQKPSWGFLRQAQHKIGYRFMVDFELVKSNKKSLGVDG